MTDWNNAKAFWDFNTRRRDQHFYTGLCIFTTVLQNYSDAHVLEMHHFSEWSITAYYYALMHSCRMMLFLIVGDFSMSHRKLPDFLEGTREVLTADWLNSIIDRNSSILDDSINRADLIHWLGQAFEKTRDWDAWLKKKGSMLNQLRKMRNRINYEGLLVAHRALPPLVTHTRASRMLLRAREVAHEMAKEALIDSGDVLRAYVDKNDIGNRWKSYLNWNYSSHSQIRVHESGKNQERPRIEGVEFLSKLLLTDDLSDDTYVHDISQVISKMRCPSVDDNTKLSESVYINISRDVFSEKSNQFRDFEDEVRELERILAST